MLIVSDTSAVELKIDPAVVLATRKYVDGLMAAHKLSRDHPDASETAKGFTRYATQVEVNETVTANQKADAVVTVKTLWGWVKQASETVLGMMKVATQAQTDIGTDDDVAVTPKKLRFGFVAQLSGIGYIKFPSWLGGLIVQWGITTVPINGSINVTLPITFPNAGLQAWAAYDYPDSTVYPVVAIRIPANSQIQLGGKAASGNNFGIRWLVIGY
ncbi:hypothetical protein D3C87_1523780 [compost metagenome]